MLTANLTWISSWLAEVKGQQGPMGVAIHAIERLCLLIEATQAGGHSCEPQAGTDARLGWSTMHSFQSPLPMVQTSPTCSPKGAGLGFRVRVFPKLGPGCAPHMATCGRLKHAGTGPEVGAVSAGLARHECIHGSCGGQRSARVTPTKQCGRAEGAAPQKADCKTHAQVLQCELDIVQSVGEAGGNQP